MRINIPPLTRTLLAAIIPLSILNFIIVYIQYGGSQTRTKFAGFTLGSGASRAPYLTIVPDDSFAYPWVLIISSLVEENLMTLGVSLATVYYGGKYLERAWSSAELGKFWLVVTVVPNLITWVGCIVWYGITSSNQAL
jgi:membrane associated rhomboid family serine protease